MTRDEGAPINKFVAVASILDSKTTLTPGILAELIEMAARLEEIERVDKLKKSKA